MRCLYVKTLGFSTNVTHEEIKLGTVLYGFTWHGTVVIIGSRCVYVVVLLKRFVAWFALV